MPAVDPARPDLAEAAVDGIEAISGTHPDNRRAHAKGTLCAATFTPTAEAAVLCRAAHFASGPVRAHVRFSNGSGNPTTPDYEPREGRGMATKLYLDDGTTTDIVAITLPAFFVRTPEAFLEFSEARRPDPETGEPDMAAMGAFLEAHPEAVPAITTVITSTPPDSYFTCAYNALHAFRLVDHDSNGQFVRYRWEPAAGEHAIAPEDAQPRGADYLQANLATRLAEGPGVFTLVAALAEDGDPTDDPTAVWPDDRRRVELGRLEVTGLADDRERDGDVLVFDPTRVTDGIELSDDPILRFRSHAYSVSVLRRSGAARPVA